MRCLSSLIQKRVKRIMPEIYSMEGLIEASDADYDLLRKLIKEAGLNLEEMVRK